MNPDSDTPSSGEFCYRDADGKLRDDWIHEEILDNPEADRALARRAVAQAMRDGYDKAEAMQLYGGPLTSSDPSEEDEAVDGDSTASD